MNRFRKQSARAAETENNKLALALSKEKLSGLKNGEEQRIARKPAKPASAVREKQGEFGKGTSTCTSESSYHDA